MRVWSWRRNFGNEQAELLCDGWPVTEAVGIKWVVDACNRYERDLRDEERAHRRRKREQLALVRALNHGNHRR